ncbi:MAG: hypothetical protein WDZ41_03680 [Candidatus Babeliales bacterium]
MIVLTIFITLLFSSGANFCMEGNKLTSYEAQINRLPRDLQDEIINFNRKNPKETLKNIHEKNYPTGVEKSAGNSLHEKSAQLQKEEGFSESQRRFAKTINPRRKFPIPKILKPITKPFKKPARFFGEVLKRLYTKQPYNDNIARWLRSGSLLVVSILIVPLIVVAGEYLMEKYRPGSISPWQVTPFEFSNFGFIIYGSHLAYTVGAFMDKW